MKKNFLFTLILGICMSIHAQNCKMNNHTGKDETKPCCMIKKMQNGIYTAQHNAKLLKEAETWMKSGAWRNGYFRADPHMSVNAVEFYQQYKKNPDQWKALFNWLKNTNLYAISKGKHPIEGTSLVASVEDSENGALEKRQSESHRKRIDFQFAVKGTERFGIIEHQSSSPIKPYDEKKDVIHYKYDKEKTLFFDSTPDKFFIFFPGDWHIAKVMNDTQDQNIRVIVIKVDYKE